MQLNKVLQISGKIKAMSGLHIGAGEAELEIGGLDNPIIKHPYTKEPFIPGSSIKGKMRSLLELKFNRINSKGGPCNCGNPDCEVCPIFGVSGAEAEKRAELGPTRLLVRDSTLTEEWQNHFQRGDFSMEVKYENSINRITGEANPRPLERVPAGVEFDFSMTLRVFKNDEREKYLNTIKQGIALLQLDSLGGSGSRGCGQVEFKDLKFDGKDVSAQEIIASL